MSDAIMIFMQNISQKLFMVIVPFFTRIEKTQKSPTVEFGWRFRFT